jgi:hypothetical protein
MNCYLILWNGGRKATTIQVGQKISIQKGLVALPMKQLKLAIEVPPGYHLIFRPFITLKNGKKLWAWQCGKKAFPLVVKS